MVFRLKTNWNTLPFAPTGPGLGTLVWLTLCQFYINVEVEYLPVYTPNEQEKTDALTPFF